MGFGEDALRDAARKLHERRGKVQLASELGGSSGGCGLHMSTNISLAPSLFHFCRMYLDRAASAGLYGRHTCRSARGSVGASTTQMRLDVVQRRGGRPGRELSLAKGALYVGGW